MSSKSILLKCIYVCAKDLHVPLERSRSIGMFKRPAFPYMYVGRTCVSLYVYGEDLHAPLERGRSICMWGGPASLYMHVGRSRIPLYKCGKDLRLSICMWGGPASLHAYVGRTCVSLCVCGEDVHSPPGVYVCGGDLHSSLEGNSVESSPMLLHVQPFSSCSQKPKNYTAREEGFIGAYICANIYTAGI